MRRAFGLLLDFYWACLCLLPFGLWLVSWVGIHNDPIGGQP